MSDLAGNADGGWLGVVGAYREVGRPLNFVRGDKRWGIWGHPLGGRSMKKKRPQAKIFILPRSSKIFRFLADGFEWVFPRF